jgi:hypothetical protein
VRKLALPVLLFLLGAWGVLVFFAKYSDTRFAQAVREKLGPFVFVSAKPEFALEDFAQRIDRSSAPYEGQLRISQTAEEGWLEYSGDMRWERNPMTGKLEPNFWIPGMEHTYIGKIEIDPYVFESDAQDPLVFKVDATKGLVYLRGRGTVTMPDGRQVKLPKE